MNGGHSGRARAFLLLAADRKMDQTTGGEPVKNWFLSSLKKFRSEGGLEQAGKKEGCSTDVLF